MTSDRDAEVSVLRALPVPVVLLDGTGTILDLSERAALELGRTVVELLGVGFSDQFEDRARRSIDVAMARVHGGDAGDDERVVATEVAGADGIVEIHVRLGPVPGGIAAMVERRSPSTDDLLAGMLDAVSATEVGTRVVEGALQEIGLSHHWDRAAMWVVDDRIDLVRPVAIWEREPAEASEYRRRTRRAVRGRGDGPAGRAWESATTLLDDDLADDDRFGPDGLEVPVVRVHHPITAAGRVVGVLELLGETANDPGAWVDTALAKVEPALGHLLERLRDRLAVDAAESNLAAALDAGQFGVGTLQPGSDRVEWSSRMADLHGQTPVRGAGPLGALLASVHPDDQEEIHTALRAGPGDEGLRQIEYRIVTDGEADVRWVATRISATALPGAQELVAAISSDVTGRKRAERQTQRRSMAVEGLQWVSQAIIAGRELRDTAIAVAHAATGVLGATIGVVIYEEPSDTGDELAWAVSGLPGDIDLPPPPGDLELPADLAGAGAASVVDLRAHHDVRTALLGLGLPVDVASMRSALVVPVRGEGHDRLGWMVFLHRDAGYFTDDDVGLARSIGSSTGVAIENAKRHEQQRLAAMTFQRELLPTVEPEIPGAEICVRYHPGRDGLDVGGDWYDVIDLDGDRIGLAVGDVCGHGLTAAAHMGQFRHSFRALLQASVPPAAALGVLNRLALDELHTTVTIVYIEVDLRTGECRTWRCGHLPPVIADRTGKDVRWAGEDQHRGPMLGFLPELCVEASIDHLAPGDLLLLYTDGLVERRGESIADGLERLAASFEGRSSAIDSACDEIYQLLADQGPAADDTALLALRRRPFDD